MTGADPASATPSPHPPSALGDLLAAGAEFQVLGRIAWSSNASFLVEVAPPVDDAETGTGPNRPDTGPPLRAVYKPEVGERPLGDFPPGIWQREVAAYELARALGWDCIPETVTASGMI